jgi:predicted component of type VI protein secretion system
LAPSVDALDELAGSAMAKLIYSLEGAYLGEFPIDRDRLTIGRRPSNDIHIDNLAISGSHAAVTRTKDGYSLEDLESTNGTVVNGKPVKKHVLQQGDVIELGRYRLKYVDEGGVAPRTSAETGSFADTMIMQPQAIPIEQPAMATAVFPVPEKEQMQEAASNLPGWAILPEVRDHPGLDGAQTQVNPPSEERQHHRACLKVLNGPGSGTALEIRKTLTTLGKAGGQVAVITKRPHGYVITHVEGNHHPVVNEQSIGAQAYALHNHDVIELAGIKMEFYFSES